MDDDGKVVPMVRKDDAVRYLDRIDRTLDAFMDALNGNTGVFQSRGFIVTVEEIKDD